MKQMTRRSDKDLFMLAFDQRGSFTSGLFNIKGTPTPEETALIADAKRVIFEGLNLAVIDGVPRASVGLLVDEQFGAEVARMASAIGYTLAMPVEKSGQNEFDFEYGVDFGQHIEAFDPAYAKVLVRYNPDGDSAMNGRQLKRLATLSSCANMTADFCSSCWCRRSPPNWRRSAGTATFTTGICGRS